MLESALGRARNVAIYERADLAAQAVTLLWGVVRNHPFNDGNKRSGVVFALVFLALNGFELAMSDDEFFDVVVGVANARLRVDEVAGRFREHLRRRRR